MNIIFLGAPGSGKGTQATEIADHHKIVHLSTGDVFRKHMSEGTDLGLKAKEVMNRGELVSDDITNGMVEETLKDSKFNNGVLLDGYPRTINQAEALTKMLEAQGKKVDAVVLLDIDQSLLLERLTGRRSCPKCKSTYHIMFSAPKVENICDMCGTELAHRADDQADKVSTRLDAYNEQTAPLIDFYKKAGLLKTVDASKSMKDVTTSIIEVLKA